jgi:nucleoside-diphosphate-sugar epimerase
MVILIFGRVFETIFFVRIFSLMKKTIIITGAGGFIGSHLLNLLKENYEIFALSHKAPIKSSGVNVLVGNLAKNISHILPKKIDLVLHLAQSNFYRDPVNNGQDIFDVNTLSTFNLLNWAQKAGAQKFIYSSTANVYESNSGILTESSMVKPMSLYAASKASAEMLVGQFSSDFHTTILRVFTVYGPGQKNMLVSQMIERLKSNDEISLAGGKGIFLTPIYISDAAQLMVKLIYLSKYSSGDVFNLSGLEETSLAEIVSILAQILEVKPNLLITDGSPGSLIGSPKKLLKTLNYLDLISLHEGLRFTANS